MQEHLDRRVFPDQRARLDQDPLAWGQIADERVARSVQEQQAGDVVAR